jgi:hypothetical protein
MNRKTSHNMNQNNRKNNNDDFPIMKYSILFAFSLSIYLMCNEASKLMKDVSPNKFMKFSQYYASYPSQHTNYISCMLHILQIVIFTLYIMLSRYGQRMASSLLPAVIIGLGVGSVTKKFDHGWIEIGCMLSMYIISLRLTLGTWTSIVHGLLMLIILQLFPIIGHLIYEKNIPDNTIHYSYNILGDFKYFFDILTKNKK